MSGTPLVLAIDTSTEVAAIALSDGIATAELVWPAGRTQTTSVLEAIDALLSRTGRSIEEVSAVAVAIGPGTFTGLRVGLSVAKGLVLARDVALIGVPTLSVTAAPFLEAGTGVLTVLPAGRGRVVCVPFIPESAPEGPSNMAFDAFVQYAAAAGLPVAGELSPDQRGILAEHGVSLASVATSIRRPGVLAQLARERLDAGERDDPVTLEPMYVHGVQATTKPVVDRLRRSA